MKNFIYLILIAFFLNSCASLTNSQINAVHQFSQTSQNFSAYPSKIINELAEVRIQRGLYFSNSIDNPELHIQELDSLYSSYRSDFELLNKVDITFKIIDKYIQSLLLLSSSKHTTDLELQAKRFGVGIDSLITLYNSIEGSKQVPSGMGGAINKIIVTGGKQYIKSKQANEIKRFVPKGDSLIYIMTENLPGFLSSGSIDILIKNEERAAKSNHLSFLRHRKPTISNEKDYLTLISKLDGIKKLQTETVSSTKSLRTAHKKLMLEIQKKKTIKNTLKELQVLYDDIKLVQSTIKNIEKI